MTHMGAAAVQWSVTDRGHSSQNQTLLTVLSYREFFVIHFCYSVTCPTESQLCAIDLILRDLCTNSQKVDL